VLPELRERLARMLDRLSDAPISLDLKGYDAIGSEWYARNGFNRFASLRGTGTQSWSNEPVTVETALSHPAVWACNRIVSEPIGFFPLELMIQKGDSKNAATDHPLYQALHDAPNGEMSAMTFRQALTSDCALYGNAFAQIIRRAGTGTAIELYRLHPTEVKQDRNSAGGLVWIVKRGNSPEKSYTPESGKPHEIFHMPYVMAGCIGILGRGVVDVAKQSIGTALAIERYVGTFYANGGRVPYILKTKTKFKNDEDYEKFRSKWESVYSQPNKAPILEGGEYEYEQIGQTPIDSQLVEARIHMVQDLCRFFGTSPHLAGDLSHGTYSNIEHLALEFVKVTLTAGVTRWEKDLWRCALTPEERRAGYYFKHNLNVLLRGDFATRMAGYATQLQNGIADVNEIRALEDLNPIADGNKHLVQLNMQSLANAGEPKPIAATTPKEPTQ
jgi:HK97 family phage portal protein